MSWHQTKDDPISGTLRFEDHNGCMAVTLDSFDFLPSYPNVTLAMFGKPTRVDLMDMGEGCSMHIVGEQGTATLVLPFSLTELDSHITAAMFSAHRIEDDDA